jgi:hypothetical protein
MKDPLDANDDAPTAHSSSASGPTVSSAPASTPGLNGGAKVRRPGVRRPGGPARRPAGSGGSRSANRPARPPRPAQPSHSARPTSAQPGQSNNAAQDDDDGFIGRHRSKLVIGVIVLLGVGAALFLKSGKPTTTTKTAEVKMVSLPPPPPPKVQQPPKPDEKMMKEEAPVDKPPDAPKPAAAPETLGTNLKSDSGEGLAGLGGSGNGGGTFGGLGGGGGSKFGRYASQVQKSVADALRKNNKTKTANMTVQVRIWADSATGRVTRAKLDQSTGDPSLDDAVQNQVLTGLQLQSPPPPDMHMPIVMRLTARRP